MIHVLWTVLKAIDAKFSALSDFSSSLDGLSPHSLAEEKSKRRKIEII